MTIELFEDPVAAILFRVKTLTADPELTLYIERVLVVPATWSDAMRLVPADVRKRLAAEHPVYADVYGFPPSRTVH